MRLPMSKSYVSLIVVSVRSATFLVILLDARALVLNVK